MTHLYKKATILLLTLALVLTATAAFADGGSDDLAQVTIDNLGTVGTLADGRLNGLDLGAPVAIYYTYTSQQALDEQGDPLFSDGAPVLKDVITGIELWGLVGETFHKVISVSLADLNPIMAADANATIASGQGYSLNYAAGGYFWIAAPPDGEGKVYSFAWQAPAALR